MKLDVKRLLITTGIVILAAAVVGGTTWYVMDQNAKKDKEQYEKQISELEEQVEQDDTAGTTVEANETTTVTESTYTDDLGKYTLTLPKGYVVSKAKNCEGTCATIVTVNRKINDVSFEQRPFIIHSTDYQSAMTLDKFNENDGFLKRNTAVKVDGTIKVGGVTATKYSAPGMVGQYYNIRFVRGNVAYDIDYNEDTEKKLVDIISTIKFN